MSTLAPSPPTGPVSRRPVQRRVLVAVCAAVLGVALALLLAPRPPTLSAEQTGDAELAAAVRSLLPDDGAGHRGLAVAVVDADGARTAGLGSTGGPEDTAVDASTQFEIGSVSKPLTGMLLAALAESGDVALDDPVASLVPGWSPADGQATLEELATHRSGLPRLPSGPAFLARALPLTVAGGNPYGYDAEQVLAFAGDEGAPGGADPVYSNLGAATLGQALAATTSTSYADLLRERVTGPLGMTDTVAAVDAQSVPDRRAHGVGANGLPKATWETEGFAPAGAVWSTAGDLSLLLEALLAGTAPGQSSLEPRADYPDGNRIGLFWITSDREGHTVTWHNGATGGFTAWVGVDAEAGRAVAVLDSSTADTDELGWQLLLQEAAA